MSRQHLLLFMLLAGATVGDGSPSACDGESRTDPLTLRGDQLTVVLTGFSELRIPLLRSLAAAYSAHPAVSGVVLLWSNPSTPASLLLPLYSVGVAITLLRLPSTSLNSRFLPIPSICTRAVLVADDDVVPDAAAISFAFDAWLSRPAAIVGFFARSHELDVSRRQWVYTTSRRSDDRYSIVLTKLAVISTELLWRYSCSPEFSAARAIVDRARNCEDILMNFVAAWDPASPGPVLVDAGEVRDWGDPRNRAALAAGGEGKEEEEVKRVGLSSREEHWKRRGECITDFHRVLGRMPLRYVAGKVVAGVGEEGLCRKAGKLVPCDRD